MLRMLSYLLSKGIVTEKTLPERLDNAAAGMPAFSDKACEGAECLECVRECPTDAITISSDSGGSRLELNRGACINCSVCIDLCPTGAIIPDRNPVTAAFRLEDLLLDSRKRKSHNVLSPEHKKNDNPFRLSVAARVVSTGCSACDLEIAAAGNPIFDMERFGVHVVASPRFADVLLVTGPVPKAMHDPLKRCYEAMAEPRRVIAVGTCACTGGIHKDGYTQANGASAIIPVDVFIPGCPPHPWSIIAGILLAMDRLPAQKL